LQFRHPHPDLFAEIKRYKSEAVIHAMLQILDDWINRSLWRIVSNMSYRIYDTLWPNCLKNQ
jgi:hypothetical protein